MDPLADALAVLPPDVAAAMRRAAVEAYLAELDRVLAVIAADYRAAQAAASHHEPEGVATVAA